MSAVWPKSERRRQERRRQERRQGRAEAVEQFRNAALILVRLGFSFRDLVVALEASLREEEGRELTARFTPEL